MNRPGLSMMAQQQLAAWLAYAQDWDVYLEDGHVRCVQCDQSITRLTDRNGVAYQYTQADQWALLVAHLRQAHQEVEGKVYGDNATTQTAGIADSNSGGIPASVGNSSDSGLSD